MNYLLYIATLMASWFGFQDPTSTYNVYCHEQYQICHIDREESATHEEATVWTGYPYGCVNGTYMMINTSGWPSGREDVFDVGPHNPPTTQFDNCGTNRKWGWLNGLMR